MASNVGQGSLWRALNPTAYTLRMGQAASKLSLDAAAFLAWDATQDLRHEYFDGEVFAMAGVEDRHATVVGNIYMALRPQLRGSPCRIYTTDVKLRVEAANCYFYPDVMVTRGAADAASRLIKREAVFVAEVLSPGTAAFDRGAKFAAYRKLESLREYLLIDIDAEAADLYRKGADGLWVLHPLVMGGSFRLASVDVELVAADLFADLEPAGDAGAAA